LSHFFLAKIHCISDIESIDKEQPIDLIPFHIIPRHTERTIRDAIGGKDKDFVNDMVSFAMVSLFY
jgi:hypothetical protein